MKKPASPADSPQPALRAIGECREGVIGGVRVQATIRAIGSSRIRDEQRACAPHLGKPPTLYTYAIPK